MDAIGKRKSLEEKKPSLKKRSDYSLANQAGALSQGASKLLNQHVDEEEIEELAGLDFEDPFGDEFDDEELDDTGAFDSDADDENDNLDTMDTNDISTVKQQKELWRPDIDGMEDDEELEYDPSAYVMYHSIQPEWPCLSFDFLRDEFGDNRQRFPLSMLLVSGSQADKREKNKVTILKLSDVHKTKAPKDEDDDNSNDDDDDDDDNDDLDEDPTIESISSPHIGAVNRIRAMPQKPGIIATMSDTNAVHIFDFSATVQSYMSSGPRVTPPAKPAFTFRAHKDEGFALDWSSVIPGRLATGDCKGQIYVWNSGATSQSWNIDLSPFSGHTDSVEDIQWSPTEGTVFISASVDKTVRVWDVRGKNGPQITFQAHETDVNVVSWNRSVSYLLASGCDDGSFKVWDLRALRGGTSPVAHFTHHKQAVTSIEWAPHDESVLCLSSEDDQVTVWDLSVEADDAALAAQMSDSGELPAQLLFVHQGQREVKEVHHHPQIPGVIMSSAGDTFDLFKPAINVSS